MPPETQKGNFGRHYAVFLSYRHADNKEQGRQWATWLHQALEGYEIPADLVGTKNSKGDLIPGSLYPVFRDEEELPADSDLTRNIRRALEKSDLMVVLCSPRAVASRFVAEEIRYFKELGKADRILAFMIDGEPNASDDSGKEKLGIRPEAECLPLPLRYGVAGDNRDIDWDRRTEPIGADARPEGMPEQGWTTGAAYRDALQQTSKLPDTQIAQKVNAYERRLELAKLKVVAGALGLPLGILTERDKAMQLRKAKQRSRALRQWLAAVGVLALLAAAGGIFAWHQKQSAEQALNETRKTLSRSDFFQALRSINEDRDLDALSLLARSVSLDRDNHAALCRLITLLIYRDYPTPTSLFKHAGYVTTAQFSPDRKRILTASYDKTARVWDAETGKALTEPMRHDDVVLSAQFSPDGKRIVTASQDKTARIWDGETGKALTEPMKHDDNVTTAQFSPDGRRIVTASDDKTARIWDGETGKALTEPMKHDDSMTTAQFSPDGKRIVTASWDKTARVWDAETGRALTEPMKHNGSVLSAQFSPDGKRIVTASWDKTARVWDAERPARLLPSR